MDKKIRDKIVKSPLLWIGIISLILINILSFHKEQQIEKEAINKIKMMVQNVSVNNINTFKNIITDYIDELDRISQMSASTNFDIHKDIVFLKEKDSLFKNIEIINYPLKNKEQYIINVIFEENPKYIQIITPISEEKSKNAISLKIALNDLHKKVAEDKNLSYAYLTLTYKDLYIYHPDEHKIGTLSPKQAIDNAARTVLESYSDYLNIPVFSFYEVITINNEEWTITANVPDISFNELVTNIRTSFIITSISVTLAFGLILFLGLLFWQKELIKKQQIKQEKIELELKNELQKQQALANEIELLKSGLNPHFLFNSLSSLKILINKNTEEAKEFAMALSNLYRYLLKQQGYDLTSLADELEFAKNYIFLQQIRFQQKIRVSIDINKYSLKQKLPPLSLQLLIENCIKHTKMSESEPLLIKIKATSNYLIVKNNYNPPYDITSSGIGLENLIKRYSHLTSLPCIFTVENGYYIAKIPLLY